MNSVRAAVSFAARRSACLRAARHAAQACASTQRDASVARGSKTPLRHGGRHPVGRSGYQ